MSDPILDLALHWLNVDEADKSPATTFAQAYVATFRDKELLEDRYARQYRELNDTKHEVERLRERTPVLVAPDEIKLFCDEPGCDAQLASRHLIAEDRIPQWAMAAGWGVTESKHYCPRHKGVQ